MRLKDSLFVNNVVTEDTDLYKGLCFVMGIGNNYFQILQFAQYVLYYTKYC